jgi:hypothetical protein
MLKDDFFCRRRQRQYRTSNTLIANDSTFSAFPGIPASSKAQVAPLKLRVDPLEDTAIIVSPLVK